MLGAVNKKFALMMTATFLTFSTLHEILGLGLLHRDHIEEKKSNLYCLLLIGLQLNCC